MTTTLVSAETLVEVAPIKLTAETLPSYAIFFHYVRGEIGRFIIVEKPEDVAWLPNEELLLEELNVHVDTPSGEVE